SEAVVERVQEDVGPYLQRRWAELAEHPLVGEARSVGLIGALELVADKERRTFFDDPGEVGGLCRDLCIANGLVMRAVRDTMIIAPPLVITHAQIDELIDKARRSLDMTLETVRRRTAAERPDSAEREALAGRKTSSTRDPQPETQRLAGRDRTMNRRRTPRLL